MIRVCIVCEGQTEMEFVRTCLANYLVERGISIFPTLLQSPHGNHRGGQVTVERLVNFISHQYHHADRITTLVDFYGFKNRNGRNRGQLESAILAGVAASTTQYDRRFVLPYIQMYEFEGLLFADPEAFEWVEDAWTDSARSALAEVVDSFANPEEINNGQETAPSKRIARIFSKGEYSKTEHGPLIAESIGVDAIRAKCPGFSEWLGKLEQWA